MCPSQCQAHSHQAGGWTGRGPHLHSRHALGQWPPSRNSYAPDHWVTPSPSLTGDLRFSRWCSPREPLENHLESSGGRISHFLITFPFSWYSSLLGPREGENAFYIILAAMWKRHISRDIGFGLKTHICKAYVKNVMLCGASGHFVKLCWPWGRVHRAGHQTALGKEVGGHGCSVFSYLLSLQMEDWKAGRTLVRALTCWEEGWGTLKATPFYLFKGCE